MKRAEVVLVVRDRRDRIADDVARGEADLERHAVRGQHLLALNEQEARPAVDDADLVQRPDHDMRAGIDEAGEAAAPIAQSPLVVVDRDDGTNVRTSRAAMTTRPAGRAGR